jgi:hypothetical protein
LNGVIHRRDGARQDLVIIYRCLAREAGIRTADRFLAAAEAAFIPRSHGPPKETSRVVPRMNASIESDTPFDAGPESSLPVGK